MLPRPGRLAPNEKCPKCGCSAWDGPRWHKIYKDDGEAPYGTTEYLEFICIDCRYPMQVPCLDAKK